MPLPFDFQPTLKDEIILLRPLTLQDFDDLYAVASDPLVWEQHPSKNRHEVAVFKEIFRQAIESKGALVAIDTQSGKIIGSSRFHDFDASKSEVEIGWTFLARAYWGGKYNGAMKKLMLDHAFRFVDAVVFSIGPSNIRSRRAVEKLGAMLTGASVHKNGIEHVVYRLTRSDWQDAARRRSVSGADYSVIGKYRHPALFYLLSTIIPWAFWFTAGYVSHMTPRADRYLEIASILGFVGLLGPMSMAFWLILKDPELRSDLRGRLFNVKEIRPVYLLLTIFLMLASILLAQAISLLFGYSPSQFVITGHFTFSSGIFPVWFMLIIAPLLEELGWHSYGTDCLRSRMNLFKTSMLFGVFWAVWHIPLSTIKNYYQSNLVAAGWIYGANFLVSIIPYVILMNWLYYKTGRSILVAIVFHITAGFFNEIFATHPDSKIIQTMLLVLLAGVVVMKERAFFFQRELEGAGKLRIE